MTPLIKSFSAHLLTVLFVVAVKTAFAQADSTILSLQFNSKDELNDWYGSEKYKMVKKDGRSAVRFNRKNAVIHLNLPADVVRGAKLKVTTIIKGQNVGIPPNSWNGVKAMIHSTLPWGDLWDQSPVSLHDFDWMENTFVAGVPIEAESVTLSLGLEEVKGKVWFDKLEVKVFDKQDFKPDTNIALANFINNDSTQLRGTMVATFIPDTSLDVLASWGANHIRWQITWDGFPYSPADNAALEEYMKWYNTAIDHFDSTILPACEKHGIKILIDLHTPPGGRSSSDFMHNVFKEKKWQEAFIDIWKGIATKYKDKDIIWGYDLLNEPMAGDLSNGLMNWQELATATGKAIRSIDTSHVLVVEGDPSGVAEALTRLKPIPVSNVVYSFHMYAPPAFTAQGLGERPIGLYYPGQIDGRYWDIDMMRRMLAIVRQWQLKYNARIYVGEFSAVRWAPGQSTYYYLRDCIELFEEMGWDWAYHAFREYDGWSVEHSGDIDDHKVTDSPTLSKQLLINSFKKNKRCN